MKVLGIDPGFDRLGIALMTNEGPNGALLFSDCIETDRALSFEQRLAYIGEAVRDALVRHKPDILALERLYFNNNQRTAMRVAEVRGTMVYLAELHNTRLVEYTPQQVKVAVTGHGRSSKTQVASMILRLVPGAKQNALDDEQDAIAIALTALVSVR